MSRNSLQTIFWMVLLAVILVLHAGNEVRATTFIVNSSWDNPLAGDKNPGDDVCLDDFDECTLRAAIEEANADSQADTITFSTSMNIFVSGTAGALPTITESVIIDASSVWDSVNNLPGVTLNGGGGIFSGLRIEGQSCAVYGLHITNFGVHGILIYSANNTIGGTQVGQRNVLSGNGNTGVIILSSTAFNNVVQGNFIGLSTSGTAKEPNLQYGVYIGGGADLNTIGGSALGATNYISGNAGYGVHVVDSSSVGNKIGGNIIGLPVAGGQEAGNGYDGIFVSYAVMTEIGGGALPTNLIAKNGWNGIRLDNASQTTIQDNWVFLNARDGIQIYNSWDNQVLLNDIAGNTHNGVLVEGTTALRNEISSNSIFNNGRKGIELENGGNGQLPAPVITSAGATQVSGTASGGARIVQVYSDGEDEGETYHGMCIVSLPSGAWTYTGTITGPNITALSFDVDGNTSEFSAPFSDDSELLLILPGLLDKAKSRKRE